MTQLAAESLGLTTEDFCTGANEAIEDNENPQLLECSWGCFLWEQRSGPGLVSQHFLSLPMGIVLNPSNIELFIADDELCYQTRLFGSPCCIKPITQDGAVGVGEAQFLQDRLLVCSIEGHRP